MTWTSTTLLLCLGCERSILGGRKITDLGVAKLKTLVALQSLDLSETQVTGVGLKTVALLPKLERLRLWKAGKIDDTALPFLAAMKQLSFLDLAETAVAIKAWNISPDEPVATTLRRRHPGPR
jgi:hypothetical protein